MTKMISLEDVKKPKSVEAGPDNTVLWYVFVICFSPTVRK